MFTLAECQAIINQHVNALKLPDFPSQLYAPIRYMLQLEAKRLRPSLVIMGCNVFTDHIEHSIDAALAIEVFHNFTLMHDDIMDKSDLRRNKPTVHVKWNPNVAVLSGDAMLILSYELLARTPNEKLGIITPVFNQTALKVCEGQQYDMDYETNPAISIQEYLHMVECKTAVLLAASLKIGALIGGAGDQEADHVYEFGRNLGIAFQLQDDWLDVYADPEVFGKVTGNDIINNKKTILLVKALQLASGSIREELLQWLSPKPFDREEKIGAIKEIYRKLGLEQQVMNIIGEYCEKASASLLKLSALKERTDELKHFSTYLMNRKK